MYEPSGETNTTQTVADEDKDLCFRYRGALNRNADTDAEVFDGGKYLAVHDTQVKPLMKERIIFEYSIAVKVD